MLISTEGKGVHTFAIIFFSNHFFRSVQKIANSDENCIQGSILKIELREITKIEVNRLYNQFKI